MADDSLSIAVLISICLFLYWYRWQQFVESDAIPVGPAEKAAFLWPLLSGVQLKALSQNPVTNDCVSSQCVTLTNQQYYCHFSNQCFLLVSSVQFPTAMRINSNICVTSVVIHTLYNIWSVQQIFIIKWMFVYIMLSKRKWFVIWLQLCLSIRFIRCAFCQDRCCNEAFKSAN